VATFAEEMVTKYEGLLRENAGAKSVTVDGIAVSYADLEVKHQYWKKQVAVEKGERPPVATVDLSKAT
jgi:hypothetical protein